MFLPVVVALIEVATAALTKYKQRRKEEAIIFKLICREDVGWERLMRDS